jgi:hypothetical protein
LAGRVLLKIVYLLTCRVLGVAVLVFRGDRATAAELLVLLCRLKMGFGSDDLHFSRDVRRLACTR